MGNRDPFMAPHGFFPCRGDDNWISLCIRNDGEWRVLCELMERPELMTDDTFVTRTARKKNEDQLEQIVSAWTLQHDRWDLTDRLQKSGIASFPVQTCKDLVNDPHLNSRDFFVRLEHPEVGVRTHAGIPWHFSSTPLAVRRPAPLLGQHNEYVVKEILGYSNAQFQTLVDNDVLY
jgi:crotonobetainyl-CoA:carnitine CoA-transferase CaiB-like acyl-CoA transferase